jgi:hypothetical protein
MSRAKGKAGKARSRVHARSTSPTIAAVQLPPAIAALQARAQELNMTSEQNALVASLLDAVHGLTNERAALAAELERTELRLKKALIARFGRKAETLTRDALIQLMLSFGASEERARAEEPEVPHEPAPEEPVEDAQEEPTKNDDRPKKKRPNHPGRTALSPNLECIIDAGTSARRAAPVRVLPA